MRNGLAYTVVLAGVLGAPAPASAQLLGPGGIQVGPDGVRVGDRIAVGTDGVQVGDLHVQVREPVEEVVGELRRVLPVPTPVPPVVNAPAVPQPPASAPSPQAGAPPAQTSGGGGEPQTRVSGDAPADAPAGSPPPAAAPRRPAAGGPAAPGRSGDAGDPTAPRGSSRRETATRLSDRAERRVRRAVARLSGCLDELAAGQRRVLMLRGGVGGPARSRQGVARRLDVRVARVRRLERSGLRRARALVRAGACGERGAGAIAAGSGVALASAQTSGGADGGSGTARPPAAVRPPADGARGVAVDGGDVRGESAEGGPPLPQALAEPPVGIPLGIALALVALATIAGFFTPALRARLGRR